jgi:REP element-mobilizing transposase RayT
MLVLHRQSVGPATSPSDGPYRRGSREATRRTQTRHPFTIDAMVVLGDHIHAVWTLPPGDADFSLRWRLIEIGFAKAFPKSPLPRPSP